MGVDATVDIAGTPLFPVHGKAENKAAETSLVLVCLSTGWERRGAVQAQTPHGPQGIGPEGRRWCTLLSN